MLKNIAELIAVLKDQNKKVFWFNRQVILKDENKIIITANYPHEFASELIEKDFPFYAQDFQIITNIIVTSSPFVIEIETNISKDELLNTITNVSEQIDGSQELPPPFREFIMQYVKNEVLKVYGTLTVFNEIRYTEESNIIHLPDYPQQEPEE